jgi:hypothetical protein
MRWGGEFFVGRVSGGNFVDRDLCHVEGTICVGFCRQSTCKPREPGYLFSGDNRIDFMQKWN